MKKNNWFEKGLHFQCTGCGKCCTGTPGFVWVNEAEIEKMANHLKITVSDFKKRYTRRIGNRLSLTEMKKNYDCVFLKGRQCSIYEVRPTQCRTYPFWPQNLSSSDAWHETAKACEGISSNARLVSSDVIEEQKLIQLKRNENPSG